jgi:hypothetical protein
MTDELGLTPQERETLAIAQEMHTLSLHNGWRRMRLVLKQWEDEALHSMAECLSSDPLVRSNMQLRWDERRKTNNMIDVYLASVLEQRKALLREIAEQRGNSPQEAFEIAEQL